MNKKHLQALCESAVLIALAFGLSFVEIQLGASGGSINFTMLPLLILAYRRGAAWGIGSGAVFGFIKCLVGGGLVWGLPSVLLDYVIAYAVVGVAGFFMKNMKLLEVGAVIGCVARYAIHTLSGVVLYAITVPTEVALLGTFSDPIIYSLAYNAVYMVPSSVVCVALLALLRPALKKMDKMFK